MRYCFFMLIMAAMLSTAHAQFEEQNTAAWTTMAELKTLGSTKASMQFTLSGSDTVYMLLMKDFRKQRETNYFSVVFNNTGGAFEKCYDLLMSFFTDENRKDNDYIKTVKLGRNMVNIQHQALIGSPGIRVTTNDGYITFSKHDVKKLFGKL